MNMEPEHKTEGEMLLTFVKYSAPEGSNQIIISVFRDVIDKEFHCDQIEWFRPPLVKLPGKPNK